MTLVLPGSGLERLGLEEWPWVERASWSSVGAGPVDEDCSTPLCGAEGSRRTSGSLGDAGRPDEAVEEVADVLIECGGSTSFRFLLVDGESRVVVESCRTVTRDAGFPWWL